jgi:amino acid transporter
MIWNTVKAVLWAFLGIRKASEYQKDVTNLNPIGVIITGILMAVVFVFALIALVNFIV